MTIKTSCYLYLTVQSRSWWIGKRE